MSTFIPPTPAATKSAEQHEEPSEQDSFNHLLFKVLRLTSGQVQDLNDWMKHRGIPNVHEIIVQSFRRPHALDHGLYTQADVKTDIFMQLLAVTTIKGIDPNKHLLKLQTNLYRLKNGQVTWHEHIKAGLLS